MNFRQLESFLTIARLGSFAAAAERLHVSQSTISARVQELEQFLGTELFDRTQRHVQLTPKGRELIPYAEQVASLFSEIKDRVGSKKTLTGVVRVGVPELVATSWLPKFEGMVRNEYPGILLEFEVGLNPFLMDGIRSGDLDIAIVGGRIIEPALHTLDLGTVRFSWLASPDLDVPDAALDARDLRQWPVIYQGLESFTNTMINQWLGIPSTRKQRGTSCTSLAAICALTTAGVGISFLPISEASSYIEKGKLKVIRTNPEWLDAPFSVIYSRQKPAKPFSDFALICVQASTFERNHSDAFPLIPSASSTNE